MCALWRQEGCIFGTSIALAEEHTEVEKEEYIEVEVEEEEEAAAATEAAPQTADL